MSPPAKRPEALILWRRADQIALGVLTLAGLLSLVGYWFIQGGHRGRFIDVDRADPRHIQFQLDLNEADWPEFAQLPDVGETLAKRIVASRRDEGPFIDHDDLRRVRGIGPKTLARVRPYLRPMPSGSSVAGR